jgi:hypothetical protein
MSAGCGKYMHSWVPLFRSQSSQLDWQQHSGVTTSLNCLYFIAKEINANTTIAKNSLKVPLNRE